MNTRWKGNGKRTVEQRRCDKADRLFETLVKGAYFERLDGYHELRHAFISVLVAQGKTLQGNGKEARFVRGATVTLNNESKFEKRR